MLSFFFLPLFPSVQVQTCSRRRLLPAFAGRLCLRNRSLLFPFCSFFFSLLSLSFTWLTLTSFSRPLWCKTFLLLSYRWLVVVAVVVLYKKNDYYYYYQGLMLRRHHLEICQSLEKKVSIKIEHKMKTKTNYLITFSPLLN